MSFSPPSDDRCGSLRGSLPRKGILSAHALRNTNSPQQHAARQSGSSPTTLRLAGANSPSTLAPLQLNSSSQSSSNVIAPENQSHVMIGDIKTTSLQRESITTSNVPSETAATLSNAMTPDSKRKRVKRGDEDE
jgi:hypothetical protein